MANTLTDPGRDDDPEMIFRAEYVLKTSGAGVRTRFFQFTGEHDREAEAALMRQAGEAMLEAAERHRTRPDPRRRGPK